MATQPIARNRYLLCPQPELGGRNYCTRQLISNSLHVGEGRGRGCHPAGRRTVLWASCLPQAPSHGCLSARVRWKEKWRQNALPTASPTNPREGQAAAWVGVEERRRCCAAQDPSRGDEVAAPSPARAARESRAAQGMQVCIHQEAAVHPGTREGAGPSAGSRGGVMHTARLHFHPSRARGAGQGSGYKSYYTFKEQQ